MSESSLLVPLAGVASISFLAASLMLPLVIDMAERLQLLDHPGGRKLHHRSIPRIGGIAIGGGAALALGAGLLIPDIWPAVGRNLSFLSTLVWGGGLIFVLGLWDDVRTTNAPFKFGVQTVAALVAFHLGIHFRVLSLPGFENIELGWMALPLTLVWIVGVTNAVNLIDGLDGLAAGVSLIICSVVGAIAVYRNDTMSAILCAALGGALVGFLRFNWSPARVFMGDSGSMLIGFVLAILAVRSSSKGPTAVAVAVPLLALGLPVFDTLLVMWWRFFDRSESTLRGRVLRMFRADRNHLHHLLLDYLRGHHRGAVISIYVLGLLFALLAVTASFSTNVRFGFLLLLLELAVVAVIRFGIGWKLGRASSQRSESGSEWGADPLTPTPETRSATGH